MEAFEQFVALAMESEGLVVSGAIKFPVAIKTKKASRDETQVHGFEVDLVGASGNRLVLSTVKSFFGSRGVVSDQVSGTSATNSSLYALLNNQTVRDAVIRGASERYGYDSSNIELRLYVGKFAGKIHEEATREWCSSQNAGAGPIRVIGAQEVVEVVRKVASSRQYRDNAVLATIKVLEVAGALVK